MPSGATVTDLSNGTFDNNGTSGGGSDTHITVDTAVITSNKTFTNNVFADGNGYAEFNVTKTGSESSFNWTFQDATGVLADETNDSEGTTPGDIIWTISGAVENAPFFGINF